MTDKNEKMRDRETVARQIANHGNNTAEEIEPDKQDYQFADYLIRNAYDIHGYHTLGRRILIVLAVTVTVLILVLVF